MEYEKFVQKRRSENREVLRRLGILKERYNPMLAKNADSMKSPVPSSKSHTVTSKSERATPSRKSRRLLGKDPTKYEEIPDEEEFEPKRVIKTVREKGENTFGAIPGVAIGTLFLTRLEASGAGVHRPTVAGIHGNPSLGCYSLALSGGYEDDVDLGHNFIYTGEGGRDLKGTKSNPKNLRTAPQSKDQVLERGNLALSKNIENNLPVRVIRGYKLKSKYAPSEGYRYDGIYNVVKYYTTTGLSGFTVFKFHLERVTEQDPAPWLDEFEKDKDEENLPPTKEIISGKNN